MAKFTIDGMDELINDIKRLDDFPIPVMNEACQKGAEIIAKSVNAVAPDGKTHRLKGSFVALKGKPRKSQRGSVAFYDVRVDPKKKAIFSKKIKNKGRFGGNRDTAFYPASVEFGHKSGDRFTKKGTLRKGKSSNFVAGKHFMRKTAKAEEEIVLTVMVNELQKGVDRILGRG